MRPIKFRGSGSAMFLYTAMNIFVWSILAEVKKFDQTAIFLMFCAIYFIVQLISTWIDSTPSEKGE